MALLIGAFLVSLIPGLAMYLWLKKQNDVPEYRTTCRKALIAGMTAAVPVCLFSFVLTLFGSAVLHVQEGTIFKEFWKTFFVFALSEETAKFLTFRGVLKKTDCASSVRDATVFMTMVGLGFGFLEAIVYGFITNPVQMLVRGVSLGHGGYGYLMGRNYAKGRQTGQKKYYILSYIIPYLLHALYDFTLSDVVLEWNDNLVFIPVNLALFSVILVFFIIRWMKKAQQDETLTAPLVETAVHEV